MKKIIYKGNNKGKLYIMRGLPGSGKSTLASAIGGKIFSTDEYFIKNGKYEYDIEKFSEAHSWNIERTKNALEDKNPIVIVDNTNTRAWEIKPYVELGIKNDYTILLVEPDTNYKWDIKKLFQTNTHGVSEETILKKYNDYEYDLTLNKILSAVRPIEKLVDSK